MKKNIIWIVLLCALVLASVMIGFTEVSFDEKIFEKLGATLGSLFLVALIIERGLDVFLTTLRAKDSEKLAKEIAETKVLADAGDETKKNELKRKESEQLEFKARTRIYALWSGLTIGIIISIIGFHSLGSLVDPVEFESLEKFQKFTFNSIDIFLTGCVLAGGSDSIHKMMDAFRLFMEKKP